MRQLNIFFPLILTCLLTISACDYELLKDQNMDEIAAGENLRSQTVWQWLSANHTTDLTGLTNYAKAVKQAGLIDLMNNPGDHTIVVVRDDAMMILVNKIGYQRIEDVPPAVLKNLLLGNIFKGRLPSHQVGIGETKKFEALNGSFIYFSRDESLSDQYLLYINRSPEIIGNTNVRVRTQNLEFSNGLVHVTDAFTQYEQAIAAADAANPNLPSVKDTIWVSKDVFIRGGIYKTANNNVATGALAVNISGNAGTSDRDRRAVFQYPLRQPTFGNKIGTARLNIFVHGIAGQTVLSAFKLESKDFNENLVNWNDFPVFNSLINTVNIPVVSAYYSIDATNTISQALSNAESLVNIGYGISNDQQLTIRTKENAGGQKSFISFTSPPPTIITAASANPLIVNKETGIAVLNTTILKAEGPVAKNIAYVVTKLPINGFLVLNGIPIVLNAGFSQAAIEAGAVKYLHNGIGNADSIEFDIRDQNGGYFSNKITLNVQIQ